MKHQPVQESVNTPPIFGRPVVSTDETINLGQRRAEEMDPVDIPIPDGEIIDPKKIEPIGNYGNTETPSNVDGAKSKPDPDDIDDAEAGDDEDSPTPIIPKTR